LQDLADHDRHLAVQLERLAGNKERRWQQLLTDSAAPLSKATDQAVSAPASASASTVHDLEARMASMEHRLDQLIEALGDLVDLAPPADDTQADHMPADHS
jgi:uncharacterized protein YceH (UPF0502 family)